MVVVPIDVMPVGAILYGLACCAAPVVIGLALWAVVKVVSRGYS